MNPGANSAGSSSLLSPPPSIAPSVAQKESKSSSCHNGLCKENLGEVAGVVTVGAFVLALFAGTLIWVYSKKFKRVKKLDTLGYEIIKMPKKFSSKELKATTKCFNANRIIGHRAFLVLHKEAPRFTMLNGRALALFFCRY
ncbi:hypothetical protein AHAS_Ahas20G0168400 [Arachis hypogaea]